MKPLLITAGGLLILPSAILAGVLLYDELRFQLDERSRKRQLTSANGRIIHLHTGPYSPA